MGAKIVKISQIMSQLMRKFVFLPPIRIMKTKRRIYSWLLLSVFLPIMILSSIHVHEDISAGISCSDCINNIPHQGHISLDSVHLHDCLLCQFASLPFVVSAFVLISIIPCGNVITYVEPSAKLLFATCRHHSPRAPPFVSE